MPTDQIRNLEDRDYSIAVQALFVTTCGHGAPIDEDCEACDHENMVADQDRYSF